MAGATAAGGGRWARSPPSCWSWASAPTSRSTARAPTCTARAARCGRARARCPRPRTGRERRDDRRRRVPQAAPRTGRGDRLRDRDPGVAHPQPPGRRPRLGGHVPAAPVPGLGHPDKLRDPVQSTSKFFDALVKVKGYLDRDLHDAAQLVQRSADGDAYAQHEPDGKLLATAFTGREPATARCWYPPDKKTASNRPEALREMRRAFGSRLRVAAPAPSPRTPRPARTPGTPSR